MKKYSEAAEQLPIEGRLLGPDDPWFSTNLGRRITADDVGDRFLASLVVCDVCLRCGDLKDGGICWHCVKGGL